MARPPEEIAMLPEKVSLPKPKAPKPTVQPPLPKSNAPDPRQTLSYLRGLMENFRLEPKSKLLITRLRKLSHELNATTLAGLSDAKLETTAAALKTIKHNLMAYLQSGED